MAFCYYAEVKCDDNGELFVERVINPELAPVVHAHWVDTFQAENGYYMGICSHCYLPNIMSLYCGKCGAKMDEEVDDG